MKQRRAHDNNKNNRTQHSKSDVMIAIPTITSVIIVTITLATVALEILVIRLILQWSTELSLRKSALW